jgi:K+-transporting ATPase KdpF subunit
MGAGDIAALLVASVVFIYLLYALFQAERF